MMDAYRRRVIPLADPPGTTATVGPWSFAEVKALAALFSAEDVVAVYEMFRAHIEAHPSGNPDDLDMLDLAPILMAWSAQVAPLPALRGHLH